MSAPPAPPPTAAGKGKGKEKEKAVAAASQGKEKVLMPTLPPTVAGRTLAFATAAAAAASSKGKEKLHVSVPMLTPTLPPTVAVGKFLALATPTLPPTMAAGGLLALAIAAAAADSKEKEKINLSMRKPTPPAAAAAPAAGKLVALATAAAATAPKRKEKLKVLVPMPTPPAAAAAPATGKLVALATAAAAAASKVKDELNVSVPMPKPPAATAAAAGDLVTLATVAAAVASKGKEKLEMSMQMPTLPAAEAEAAANLLALATAAAAAASKGKEKLDVSVPMLPAPVASWRFVAYPRRMAEHEDVVADARLFITALQRLHGYLGTRFRIPILGGKNFDLHQLYKEVTARGGIYKVKTENTWREVLLSFAFPATVTNASFTLKKYYMSLLYHFEQLYFFKMQGFHQHEADSKSNSPEVKTEAQVITSPKRKRDTAHLPESISSSDGVGYIATAVMGSTSTKSVLYHCIKEPAQQSPVPPIVSNDIDLNGGHRPRRKKKKKLCSTDPNHPKPNRSGYTFFFQDQHRLFKPQYPGQDRLISKMIGERWGKLSPEEKVVYQERAAQDKERYRIQLAAYKEKRRTGQPILQIRPRSEVTIDQVDAMVRQGDLQLSNQCYNSGDGSNHSGERTVEDEELNSDTSPEMSMETDDSSGESDSSDDVDRYELRRRENPKADEEEDDPPAA